MDFPEGLSDLSEEFEFSTFSILILSVPLDSELRQSLRGYHSPSNLAMAPTVKASSEEFLEHSGSQAEKFLLLQKICSQQCLCATQKAMRKFKYFVAERALLSIYTTMRSSLRLSLPSYSMLFGSMAHGYADCGWRIYCV